jgi:hypothetical protein
MVEVEELNASVSVKGHKHFGWLPATLIRPAKTMTQVAGEEQPAWLLPLLLLTALTLISVLVAGPLRQAAALSAPPELPPNFQYMSPEQQEQFMQAQASMNGPAMTYLFPAIGALAGVWLSWFLLGAVLHLVMTLLGGRGSSSAAYNLAAWASLPFAIRLVIQIVAMVATHSLIGSPGLSGFIAADAAGAELFARILLRLVDLYLIWQFILLWLGAASTSGLTRGKAFSGVLITVVFLLVLSALPGFLSSQVSGLNISRPFMFF